VAVEGGAQAREAAPRTPEPTRRLPREARTYFLVESLGWAVPLVLVSMALAGPVGEIDGIPGWVEPLLRWGSIAAAAIGVTAIPVLRWRHWRYEVREEELDLLRGALVVTRTLIPMVRVQHVDTRRTFVSNLFELRSVVIHTAAGSHQIPALRSGEAAAIRDQIALLARQPDDV
jgi:uncharacterized protein